VYGKKGMGVGYVVGETPDGEEKLRQRQKEYRHAKRKRMFVVS
jgi:hypothetical protein